MWQSDERPPRRRSINQANYKPGHTPRWRGREILRAQPPKRAYQTQDHRRNEYGEGDAARSCPHPPTSPVGLLSQDQPLEEARKKANHQHSYYADRDETEWPDVDPSTGHCAANG
jgi:hypothetical protein